MAANTEDILAGIFNQNAVEVKNAFDDVIKQKLETTVDDYKTDYAKQLFSDDEQQYDDDGEPIEDENEENFELTDEELAALEGLTDDELEALLADAIADEEEDTESYDDDDNEGIYDDEDEEEPALPLDNPEEEDNNG